MQSPMVLCVDDDAAIRDFYNVLLSGEGYRVVAASTGSQALDLIRSKSSGVDAAILDYELPRMNGFELAVRLKQHDPHLPILMISGSVPELEDMAPFVDVALSKGVPVREIVEGLELLLAARRSRRVVNS
jgi:two-component system, OmpR family, response regulator CpxR